LFHSTESTKKLRQRLQDKGNGKYYSDWTEILPRTFSIYFTKVFILLGISANMITLLSIVAGILAGIFISLSQPIYFILGALSLLMVTILDCSDGEIARYHAQNSSTGEYLDRIAAAIIDPTILFGIGLALFKHTNAQWIITATIIAGFSLALMRLSLSYAYVCSIERFMSGANPRISRTNDNPSQRPTCASIENLIEKPKLMQKSSLIYFILDLFLIKTWGMIFWVFGVGILSAIFININNNIDVVDLFVPLLLFYAIFGPLATCYIIYSTVVNKIPDKLLDDAIDLT
jgi:phosphatidylglycerophosphate synthase